MKHTLTSKAAELMRKNGRHRRWRRAFSGMAAVVVFITTYMLILPAITMENQAICGMAEHTHTDACYEMQLVCTQEETPEGTDVHVHGPECYEQQQVLTCTKQEGEGHTHTDACYGYVCGQEESAGHTHTDACYTEVTHRELTCTEPESAGHTHGDGCYDADGNLVCTEAESTGHTHGDSCYTETVTRELTCGQEESSGHTHTDACIGLICGQEEYEGHTHTDACYTTEDVLVCTQPTGHTHGDGCYEKVLVCDVPEHTHTEECYPAAEPEEPQEPEFICTLPEHSHEDACYDADGNLICGMEEHTHTEECYAPVEIPEEELPLGGIPEEILAGEPDYIAEILTEDGKTVTVNVYDPYVAVPEGAELKADLLAEDSEEYAEAQANLDASDAVDEYTGMAALDIRFEDADGSEVEPAGQVYVDIQAQALIPEDADPDSVAVQHHVETTEDHFFGLIETKEVAVQVVADSSAETGDVTLTPSEVTIPDEATALSAEPDETADLAAETEEPAETAAQDVEAQFAVDSFSTFTITWQEGLSSTGTLTFRYWDVTTNSEFTGPRSGNQNDWSSNEYGDSVELSNYVDEIEGYTYQGEICMDSPNGTAITHVKFNRSGSIGNRKYQWQYSTDGRIFTNWGSQGNAGRDVYLLYASEEEIPGVTSATVTTGKTVILQNGEQPGGLYDLTLSVSGDRGSQSSKQKVDVLFILDESNSMANSWGQTTRITAAKNAISQIMGHDSNVGLSDNENLDVQYALVGFGGGDSGSWNPYADAGIEADWTDSTTSVYNAIPIIKSNSNRYGGGTNYEAGFLTGKEALEDSRDDALTVVIFISDGNPGYYYDKDGETEGTGNPGSSYDKTALSNAVNECKYLDTDYFYFVGVTNSVSGTVFSDIVGAVPVAESNKSAISANDPEDLLEAFNDIQQQITFFACSNVTITDPLSEYAELAENAQYTVKVTKTDESGTTTVVNQTVHSGEDVTFISGTGSQIILTPSYNDQTRTITLDFPDNYELEEGYTYSVTTTIQPTAKAIADGTASYDGRGDAGTGTHAGQPGFYSNDNDNAKVTFKPTVNNQPGDEQSEAFPKPVIQIFDPGDIEMDEPAHTKQAILRDDGTYDLTLTVSGSTGTATKKAEVDVLMIVDVSNSMKGTKLNNAKSAITALVNTLENKETVDARYNVITFAQSAYEVTNGWVSGDSDKLLSFEDKYEGTNYQAGLRLGVEQLASARPTASTVVVFLSDGEPSHYLNANGTVGGTGGSAIGTNSTGWSNTLTEAKTVNSNKFYAVAIAANENHKIYMQELRNAINEVNPGSAEYIESDSQGNNLATKFEDIAGSVTAVNCVDVTISDTLSQYAEAVMGTNGEPEELTVKVTNATGEDVTAEEVTAGNITASYDAENKILKLDFNDSYKLKQDYTYSVTLQIKPTDTAVQEYITSGTYPHTPDKGTGTHADRNENGFYSNEGATLTYKISGTNQSFTVDYDDPVIQVAKGSLSITKTVERTDDQPAAGTNFRFEIQLLDSNNQGVTASGCTYTVYSKNGNDWTAVGTGTLTFNTNGISSVEGYADPSDPTLTNCIELDHNEKIEIEGLPANAAAQITETTTDGYSTKWSGDHAGQDGVAVVGATVTTAKISTNPEVTCTNTTGAVLPSTGGMGTTPFLALGTLLTLGAGMLLVQRRRKEGSDAV